jgi:hypothetical protein
MRSTGTNSTKLWIAIAMAAGMTSLAVSAAAQPLDRNFSSYFIFASKYARLKNFHLDSACNIGVNCPALSAHSKCGQLIFADAVLANGSQGVSDNINCSKGGVFWQLFRNGGGPCDVTATINAPPIQPFVPTPIIAGTCDVATCTPDVDALKALCGFPNPFPACDPARKVTVRAGQDCDVQGAPIVEPLGDGRCQLPPGQYGAVQVRNGGKLELSPGEYDVCSLKVGRTALVTAANSVINVAAGGTFRVGADSTVGQNCGDLEVRVDGTKGVSFGRRSLIAAKVCAPGSPVKLGHGNQLIGQFVGDRVAANRDNHGQCCDGADGRCTCVDAFSPSSLHCQDDLTLTSACDLTNATGVTVCGQPAMIVVQTATEMKVKVPNVSGPCPIVVTDATGGSFKLNDTVSVTCP